MTPRRTATAYTIRSLHSGTSVAARKASGKKIKILLYSFLFAFLFTVFSKYAPGVLWDWHVGWTLYALGWKGAIALENWGAFFPLCRASSLLTIPALAGWLIEFTPAFTAVGFLTGPNAAFSWLSGAILAYGIIGPILVATGAAQSRPADAENFPGWGEYFRRFSPRS